MQSEELREKYLKFFELKGHKIIAPASLIPENDPTCLFTTAGMHPLVPYFLGESHPEGKRLVNYQKCLRTDDIEEVGDTTHLTFFEMLGNWSLGDYFKEEAITWSFEFLTDKKWLSIPPEKIFVTVFGGNEKIPKDEESIKIWQKLFRQKRISYKINERIFLLGEKDNFWGPVGNTGPCGPDTEMFYDTGKQKCSKICKPGCNCGKYVEIWNDVFMEYDKKDKNKFEFLKQKNVDTGMGLERAIMILNNLSSVFETDLLIFLIKEIQKLSNIKNKFQTKAIRIIADHIRGAVFIIGDENGVLPSNLGQGYVVRRLIRRAIRFGIKIGIQDKFLNNLAVLIINRFKNLYPSLLENKVKILDALNSEEEKFRKVLIRGIKLFEKNFNKEMDEESFSKIAFKLYETYGFPLEITEDLAKEKGLKINYNIINEEFEKHRMISRKGAEKMFKGGLADHKYKTTKLHTATHLLNQALRKILGPHIYQKGSNITSERLRFDFSHPKPLTKKELKQVEDLVNQKIKQGLPVICKEMSIDKAKKIGAIGVFTKKYSKKVKVYFIGDFSKEICGGPHVKNTKELGYFKIIKEQSVGYGIRRIKAILK